mmetsp:Transcript_47620/g.120025  ORF Transcript_47620/g.120025 Transcript_47620/m.120025 type:complete len:97 (+) Transcript_47620:1711-2001(+)
MADSVYGLTQASGTSGGNRARLTTALPMCTMAMRMSARPKQRGMLLDLGWAPRTVNQETNDLANGNCQAFHERLSVGGEQVAVVDAARNAGRSEDE